MKSCPQCESIDVPDNAKRCPFCGYFFGVKEENKQPLEDFTKEMDVESNLLKPQSLKEVSEVSQEKTKKEQDNSQIEKKETITVPKKKKHGFRNFVIIVGIAIIVYSKFISNPSENVVSEGNMQGQTQEDTVIETEAIDERQLLLSQIEYAEQYVLPLSNVMYLERSDLEGLSAEELRIARNEIYARRGRIFGDKGLNEYFNGCEWYIGTISADEFVDSIFNEYEIANRDLIKAYEHELGVNGQ